MKLATLWARIGGGLVDLLIVLLISAVILFCWGFLIGLGGKEAYLSEEMQTQLWKTRGLLVGLLVDAIYTVTLQTSTRQATLGQSAFDLIVTKKNGEKASVMQLIVRYLVSIPSSLILKIGYLIALITKHKQTLHDLVANTIVLEKTQEVIELQTTHINVENHLPTDEYVNPENADDKFKVKVFYLSAYLIIFVMWLFVSGYLKID